MNTSNVLKVVTAFLTGLVLVMGGGLIYSRTRELTYPVAGVRTAAHPEQTYTAEPQSPTDNEPTRLEQAPIPRKVRQGRTNVHRQVVRRPIVSELGQPIKIGPKIYQITASYPVPILVPAVEPKQK